MAVRNRLSGGGADSDTMAAIEANEAAPGSNISEIEAVLERDRSAEDRELRAAAEALLSRLPTDRVDHARNQIDLSHAQGVQIGDYGTQHNTFG